MNAIETTVEHESVAYEAPAIESVILPEDIEREVAYAGNVIAVSGNQIG